MSLQKWPHRYDTESGMGGITSPLVRSDLSEGGQFDTAVLSPSLGTVTVSVTYETADINLHLGANLTAEQAREMAESLQQAAGELETDSRTEPEESVDE